MQNQTPPRARSPFSKLATYFRASYALGRPNLRGLPVLPKQLWTDGPFSREQYNTFVNWLSVLALPQLRVALDVGANTGDFTQAVAAVAPAASVYMVEPLPSLHGGLQRLCANSQGRFHLSTKALSDKPGTAELFFDPSNHTIGSLLGFNQEYKLVNETLSAQTEKTVCETETLDMLTRSANLDRIDVLKIDVEGFEFHVLEGGKETLARTEAVIVELSLVRNASAQSQPLASMIQLLNEHGFSIVRLLPSLYAPTSPWRPVEFNVLARRDKPGSVPAL
jgi:FkbM family methyltransferase